MIQNNARHGCISGTKRTTQYCHSAVEKLNDAAPQFSKSNACFWQRHRPYPSCGAAIRLCPRSSCLDDKPFNAVADKQRSEEHTSELQSLMRISYAVFCLKKKNKHNHIQHHTLNQTKFINIIHTHTRDQQHIITCNHHNTKPNVMTTVITL